VLSTRTKALVFAVVAHGIGCARCEREAVRLLAAEGLTAAQVEHALAHLGGPELTELECAAAALARESIWYRPAQIQRHLRSIRTLCTREQLVELIGSAALANMVCRLSRWTPRSEPDADPMLQLLLLIGALLACSPAPPSPCAGAERQRLRQRLRLRRASCSACRRPSRFAPAPPPTGLRARRRPTLRGDVTGLFADLVAFTAPRSGPQSSVPGGR
jgi:hypothetical protein